MANNDTKELVKQATLTTRNVIKASSSLAVHDVKFCKSLDSKFANASDKTSGRLIDIANDLMDSISSDNDKLDVSNDNEFTTTNMKLVSNIIDTLFEKSDLLFDTITRQRKGINNDSLTKFTFLEESNNTTKDESKNLGRKMDKPQLMFKTKIDNSELHPFKPKLTTKPNALTSFEESVQVIQPGNDDDDQEIDPPFYPQPYQYEIDHQPYPETILSKSDVIASQPWESTTAEWIDKPEQVAKLVEELRNLTEIAIDLEHHDYRTYYGLVCLMQISNREKDWIIDTLALRDDLEPLNIVFTDPNIVKVFHGAFMDIIWLQRDLGLYIVSLFDTYHASKKLGFPRFSLAYLLETFAHFKTSKKYQLADWRIRPLLSSMLAYARSDTHFLLNIFDQLKNKLIESNGKLQDVLYESRQVAKRRFEYTKFRPITNKNSSLVSCPVMSSNPREPYYSLLSQFGINSHLKPVVEVLYNWRDKLARELDESVRFTMPNQTLASLATLTKPIDAKKVISVATNEYVRNNATELAQLINETLDLSEANDWKLFDTLESSVPKDDEELTANAIESQNSIFDQLIKENKDLLNNNKLNINKPSALFSKSKELIGVSYKDNKVKESSIETLVPRYEHVHKEFEKYHHITKVEIQLPEEPTPPVANTEPKKQDQVNKEPSPEAIKEDKDEIITLRKPKKQRQSKQKRQLEEDSEDFDYSNTDNIMKPKVENNQPKKKKKFDPYSKSSDGPRPVKAVRNIKQGRSTTFKR